MSVKKLCAPHQILNPKTGRCVRRDGKIGKEIMGSTHKTMSNRKTQVSVKPSTVKTRSKRKIRSAAKVSKRKTRSSVKTGPKLCTKPCSSHDEVCNPKSGRCVNRLSKIGSQLTCPHYFKEILTSPSYIPRFNCASLPLKDIKYILGPMSFYEFKYGERRIYLFGETHLPLSRSLDIINKDTNMIPDNTIMFDGFVKALVNQNSHKTYDLMFEHAPVVWWGKKTTSPTMNFIGRTFFNCIRDKYIANCPYKNLRVHSIDFRFLPEGQNINKFDMKKHTSIKLTKETFIPAVKNLLTSGKVFKQMGAIRDKTIVEKLIKYVEDQLSDTYINYSMRSHGVLLMDIYGIARIIREFDMDVVKPGPVFRGTSENIICYAGNTHIKNMVNFFKNYLGLKIVHKVDSYEHLKNAFIKLDVSKSSFYTNS